MVDYKKMYLKLFNAITDTEKEILSLAEKLREAQQECEEIYLSDDDEPRT